MTEWKDSKAKCVIYLFQSTVLGDRKVYEEKADKCDKWAGLVAPTSITDMSNLSLLRLILWKIHVFKKQTNQHKTLR